MSRSGAQYLLAGQELGARMRPGVYYGNAGSANSFSPTLNRLYLAPMFIPRSGTLAKIGCNINTGAAAGGVLRMGVYTDVQDSYGGFPNTLVLDTGNIDSTVAGFKESLSSVVIPAGLYWLGCVCQVASPSSLSSIGSYGSETIGVAASTVVANRTGLTFDNITGALPSSLNGQSYVSTTPTPLIQIVLN